MRHVSRSLLFDVVFCVRLPWLGAGKHRDEKSRKTKEKNGHAPTWNNSKKMVKTRYEKNNGIWETDNIKHKRKTTSLATYGVDDPNRSDIVKKHKAEAFERKYGKGVMTYS